MRKKTTSRRPEKKRARKNTAQSVPEQVTPKEPRYFDYNLLFIIIFLICFGLVMLYSTSSYTAANKFGDAAFYLKKQLMAIILGFVFLFLLAKIPYMFWKKFSVLAYLLSAGLCGAVIVAGQNYNGSQRWLQIGPVSFQPSEFAKIAMILFLAAFIERIPKQMGKFSSIIKVFVILLPILIIIAISNLSTAIIVAGIAVCMMFVASPKYSHFVAIGMIGIAGVIVFILIESYRLNRIKAWLHPETAGDDGFQTLQGLYAIGSGGLFGKGLGQSIQKMGFVPEAQNDMIFTIICEELGLFGGICVILLFLLMIWRMMIIANNAKDLFGALLVVGIMAHISLQVILNVAVVTNTIPNTGVTLPFISYGGTSMMFLMAEMGLALSVSRGIRLQNIDR